MCRWKRMGPEDFMTRETVLTEGVGRGEGVCTRGGSPSRTGGTDPLDGNG